MPYIRITVTGPALSADQRRELQSAFTREVHLLLGKRRQVTVVTVLELPAASWAIHGEPVERAAHAEIAITAGSNTPAEKAAMVRAAHACLREVLGPLPDATYVVIQEIAADAWGYGGRTQQARLAARASL
jgi:4-oxalocrotonate tautomerase